MPSPVANKRRAGPAAGIICAKHDDSVERETPAGAIVGKQSRQSLTRTFVRGIGLEWPRHTHHKFLKGIDAELKELKAVVFGFGE